LIDVAIANPAQIFNWARIRDAFLPGSPRMSFAQLCSCLMCRLKDYIPPCSARSILKALSERQIFLINTLLASPVPQPKKMQSAEEFDLAPVYDGKKRAK